MSDPFKAQQDVQANTGMDPEDFRMVMLRGAGVCEPCALGKHPEYIHWCHCSSKGDKFCGAMTLPFIITIVAVALSPLWGVGLFKFFELVVF